MTAGGRGRAAVTGGLGWVWGDGTWNADGGGMGEEVYFSTDVETDGPIPGPHSMLSLGSAAYAADGTLLGTFEANLRTLHGAYPHPATMPWWREHADAWDACRADTVEPADAMPAYADWVRTFPGTPVFVAYPAGFDFTFVYWYLVRFTGGSPFSFAALDMKTLAMAALGCGYAAATKGRMPRAWFPDRPHAHRALDDAVNQGVLFCNMLAASRTRPLPRPGTAG